MWLPPAISIPVWIPDFYAKSRSLYNDVYVLPSKWSYFTPIPSYGFLLLRVVPSVCQGGGLEEGVDLNGWVCADVWDVILVRDIYCAKFNIEPDAHSGYRVQKGLGAQAPLSTLAYDLMNKIKSVHKTNLWRAKWIHQFLRLWVVSKRQVLLVPPWP